MKITAILSRNGIPIACGRNAQEAWGRVSPRINWRKNRAYYKSLGCTLAVFHKEVRMPMDSNKETRYSRVARKYLEAVAKKKEQL